MHAGIIALSNPLNYEKKPEIDRLISFFSSVGIDITVAGELFSSASTNCPKSQRLNSTDLPNSLSGKSRAENLMRLYRDNSIKYIFDVSGGDIANEILSFLDYDVIAASHATFWGYSDLTTVINAIYTKTGKSSVLYSVKNLVGECSELQQELFAKFINGSDELYQIKTDKNQQDKSSDISVANDSYDSQIYSSNNKITGESPTIIGGNIRCLLKLAGTEYFPDMTDKTLLLESLSGDEYRLRTLFSQLAQMGVFEKVNGVLLGTFTEYNRTSLLPVDELLRQYTPESIPIHTTPDIGHGADSRAIWIG